MYFTVPDVFSLGVTDQRGYLLFWFCAFVLSVLILVGQRHLIIWELRYRIDSLGRMQQQIDQLAALRKRGVQLYANPPSNFSHWVADQAQWRQEVLNLLQAEFTAAVVEWFEDLGMLAAQNFQHAISQEHNHQLQMLAKRLAILETLIQRHTQILRQKQPTLKEVLAGAFHEVVG